MSKKAILGLMITLIFSLILSIMLFFPKPYSSQNEIRGMRARFLVKGEFDFYYNSNISSNVLGYDALKLACELAPLYGLNIHVWLTVMCDSYLISQNETYAMVKIDQSKNFEWLNPVYPEVHNYILSIVNELLHYPIKGIHLDYIRFPDNQYSYDNYSRLLFQSEYGFDPLTNPNSPEWVNWRCQQITNIVNEIKIQVKTFNHSLILSSAVIPESKEYYLQDWLNWMMDYFVPMAYTDSPYSFEDSCKMAKPKQGASKVLMGIGIYTFNDSSILIKEINLTRQYQLSGWALFRENYLYNDDFINTIKNIDQILNTNISTPTIWYDDPKIFVIIIVLCFFWNYGFQRILSLKVFPQLGD